MPAGGGPAADARVAHCHSGERYASFWYEFTPDGTGLLGPTHEDGSIRVWGVATGRERVVFKGHAYAPRHRALSADGRALVTATNPEPGEAHPVRVWGLATGKEVARFAPGGELLGVAVSGDGRRVAALSMFYADGTGTGPSRLVVWEAATGRVLAQVREEECAEFVALSPDGSLVATSEMHGGTIRVYAAAGGAERFTFRHDSYVTGLAFSPEGRTLAAASSDVPVTLWDVTGGKR